MKVPVHPHVRVRVEDGSYPYLKAAMLPNGCPARLRNERWSGMKIDKRYLSAAGVTASIPSAPLSVE